MRHFVFFAFGLWSPVLRDRVLGGFWEGSEAFGRLLGGFWEAFGNLGNLDLDGGIDFDFDTGSKTLACTELTKTAVEQGLRVANLELGSDRVLGTRGDPEFGRRGGGDPETTGLRMDLGLAIVVLAA